MESAGDSIVAIHGLDFFFLFSFRENFNLLVYYSVESLICSLLAFVIK